MSIRNEMEQLVRDEVAASREAAGREYPGCWCPLCEMDIVALALTLLPPMYCRDDGHANAAGLLKAGRIADAVQSALRRVGTWPKHRPGTLPAVRDDVGLVNYAYEVGTSMVGPALEQCGAGCTCESCRSDTLAYALNRYPAKYGVMQSGRRSLHPTHVDFMRYELGMLIHQAARVVASHPHHEA